MPEPSHATPHVEPATTGRTFRQRLLWPGMVFALLGGQIVLMLVMVYVATRSRSFAVEPNYYQQALHWDEIQARQREAAQLGWTVRVELQNDATVLGERTIVCTLADKSGQPLEGARIDMIAFAHARASQRTSAVFQSEGPGRYAAQLRIRSKGLWEFRLVICHASDVLTHTEQHRL